MDSNTHLSKQQKTAPLRAVFCCNNAEPVYTVFVMQKDELEKMNIEKKEGSEVIITGEIPFTELEKHRTSAVSKLSKEVTIDGFRKGHVPESVLTKHIGEMAIINEMAERALSQVYPEIVTHYMLDVIGYPKISITKIAKDNPLGFIITVAVIPEITLPDYITIAKKINTQKESKEITEEDVQKQIEAILRQKVAYERLQGKAGQADTHVHSDDCKHDDEDEVEMDTENESDSELKLPLPELTDEYVKGLGQPDQFKTVSEFKEKIREHLTIEKARDVDSAHRAKITDAIIAETSIDIPRVLIESEINQMFAQMQDDLTRAQLTMDDYLGHIKKTKEDLIKEWTPSAEKRAKLQLVLNEIGKRETIVADPVLVEHEVLQLLSQYKDADEARVRTYITSVLTNEAVLKKLEETV